jgi:outer membrane protein TolC
MKKHIITLIFFMISFRVFAGQVIFDAAAAHMMASSPAIKSSLQNFYAVKAALSREIGKRYDLQFNAGYGYQTWYSGSAIVYNSGNLNSYVSENLPTGGEIFAGLYGNNYNPATGSALNNSMGINLNQPLLRGLFGLPADNNIKNYEYMLEMSKENLREMLTVSVWTLKKYFVQIFRMQQYLAQNTLAIEYAQNTLATAKKTLSAGEQLEAKAFLLSRQAQQEGCENNVKSACEDFLNYAGYEGQDWDSLTVDTSSMTKEAYIPLTITAELENTLIEVQPVVERARIQYEKSRLWLDKANWAVLPQLDFNVGMQLNGDGNTLEDSFKIIGNGSNRYYSADLAFSFDVPNSGPVFDAKFWAASCEADRQNYELIKNNLRRTIRDTWRNLQQAENAYEMRKEAAEAYLKRLDIVKAAFNAGAIKVREMDLSISDAAEALSSEADAYYNYVAVLSDWNRLSGKYESYFDGYMKDK